MSDSNFNTDPEMLDLVRKMDKRGIGLDPCSNQWSLVNAHTSYTVEDDGLAQSWRGHGLVFVNPPHSMSPMNIEPWMKKAYEEFVAPGFDREDQPADQLILYVPAKTDTEWFHEHAAKFNVRCLLRGRRKYWQYGRPTSGPGKFPQMVVYHGPAMGLFMNTFGHLGLMC